MQTETEYKGITNFFLQTSINKAFENIKTCLVSLYIERRKKKIKREDILQFIQYYTLIHLCLCFRLLISALS